MPDEVKPTAQVPGGPQPQGEGSAPQNNGGGDAGGSVDTVPKQKPGGDGVPAGLKLELVKLRQERSQYKNEAQTLTERLDALERQIAQARSAPASTQGETEISPFDDPRKWEAQLLEKAKAQAKAEIEAGRQAQDEVQRRGRRETESQAAVNWLLTRSHLKEDEKLGPELQNRINAILADDPNASPMVIARSAYTQLCEDYGITPDLSKPAVSPAFASAGFRSTATGTTHSSKPRNKQELLVEARKHAPGSKEHTAILDEMRRA
jgi:hypothetical protein